MAHHEILKRWKAEASQIIKLRYPQLRSIEIDNYLDKVIEKKLINQKCQLYNNYENKRVNTNLLSITDWFYKVNPIPTEHGVFFKRHDQAINPAAVMLRKFLNTRKVYKNKMYDYNKGSFMFRKYNRKQLNEKINANAFYGVAGLVSSVFYNLHCAISITGKGRALIGLTATSFEMFLTNSIKFLDMDDCLIFIKNCVNDSNNNKFRDSEILDNDISIFKVMKKLRNTFKDKSKFDSKTIEEILFNITQKQLNCIYYKNNLYEFLRNSYIKNLLVNMYYSINSFNNPNKPPDEIIDMLKHLWKLCREYVFYNYQVFDRSLRISSEKRASVVVIDTDSNMLNLDPFHRFMIEEVLPNDILFDRPKDDLRFMNINIISYIVGEMINEVLQKFTKDCNIPEEKRKLINMKNEFLFKKLLTTYSKKNYASIQELQEGNAILEEENFDIKGLTIMKSSLSKSSRAFFKTLVKQDVMIEDEIDMIKILRKLSDFENYVRNSILKGDKEFVKPVSVKNIEAYDKPYSQQGIKAAIAWNMVYPDRAITLPDKFDIIKLKINKLQDLIPLQDIDAEKFKILKEGIFESKIKDLKPELTVIGIPRNVKQIPEWIRPFIDVDSILEDIIKNIVKILNSVGLETINVSSTSKFYSNIVEL